ncbi:MAG: hypothetical protein CBC35_03155 [Planctomycetes bacterium TMED75]|nr:acyl-CoA dehydrogenase [Planctomycetaceae bacterium]OUU94931.1 MAG: hypothetical protein CBC35_03155 [Planctomycetes bacterium TMED75]
MTDIPDSDLYRLDDLLTPQEKSLKERISSWVGSHFLPQVDLYWNQGTVPGELLRELGGLGALGTSIHGYGCPGLSARGSGVVMQALERGDSGLRTLASVQGSLAMKAIYTFGDESQREALLPPMARGELLGCFGLTEPSAGSNPGGMDTTAVRDGSDWIISGVKKWIGNADIADHAVIWAQSLKHGDPRGIRGFVVDTTLPGFSATLIKNKYSLRCGRTCMIELDSVRVPADCLLPGSEVGLRAPLTCLNLARYGIAWGVMGAAQACFEEALAYTGVRESFDRPLASYQMVQGSLADMATELTKAQLVVSHLANLMEAGSVTSEQISMAKFANVDSAQMIARSARELLGGVGILGDHCSLRHMINLESVATYEGTRDIHRLVLGRYLTGVQAFR